MPLPQSRRPVMRRLFCLAYFLSGCAGLLYEVVWTRLLTLHLGHTVAAVSTVLAAFLGGLAVGALVGGAIASRRTPREALRTYASLEAAIAASALLVPLALLLFKPLLASAYGPGTPGPLFAVLRIVTSLVVLVVPAMAMGATFPVAAVWFVDEPDRTGASAGRLYAVNTAGGALGAALAAFVLVPLIGLRLTTLAAVSLNAIAAVIALRIARAPEVQASPPPAAAARPRRAKRASKETTVARDLLVPAAAALAITGFVALVNEVVWTRILALVLGPTAYAFGVMVSIFITGLALGSAAMARLVSRIERPMIALAVALTAIAAAPVTVMWLVEPLALRVASVAASSGTGFIDVLGMQALAAAALLLPLTIALGAAFPLGIQLATRAVRNPAARIAAVYAANTGGAIAGALLSGFAMIPRLGLQRTILAAATLALTASLVSLVAARPARKSALLSALAMLVAASVIWRAPAWDTDLLSGGGYKYAAYVRTPDLASALRAGTVLYYREGAAGTVAVRRLAGTMALSIDGKVDASNGGDMLTQKLLAHLPLLLHPHPQSVAIIGLGSGVTLGAALTHPIERADTVEISPEVVRASQLFETENHRALSDPRSTLIVGDGRSHLMLTARRYDVIISEPSNPWMAGVAALFTREFFEAARHALSPNGILCQWAHTYDISDADLRSIAATFQSVFPEGTMWLVGESDLLLIGSPAGMRDRLAELSQALARPNVAADLDEVAVRGVNSLLWMWVGGPAELSAYAAGQAVQVDDRMQLEFTAPRSLVGKPLTDNAAVLRGLTDTHALPPPVRAMRASTDAAVWRDCGRMLLKAEAYRQAFGVFSKAVTLAPEDDGAWNGFVQSAVASGHEDEALRRLREAVGRLPLAAAPRIELSKLLASTNNTAGAIDVLRPLMEADEHDPRAFEQAASVFADAGDARRLSDVVAQLEARWPDRASSRYYAAVSALLDGRTADSLRLGEDAAHAGPRDPRAFNLIGSAAASLGRRDDARQAFQSALQQDPRDSAAYVNLGTIELESGNRSAALRWFAEALVVDPESQAAREGLERARARPR